MTESLQDRRETKFRIFMIAVLFIFFVMYFMTLDAVGIPMYILKSYAPALIFSIIGIGFYRGVYKGKSIYILGIAFVLWYVVSRMFLGDAMLIRSFITVIDLSLLYGVALPFARNSGDGEKRRVLDAFALVYSLVFAILAWMSVYFAITGKSIAMPQSGYAFGISEGRLQLLGQNPNHSAPLLALAFLMTIYLLAGHFKKWRIIPAVLALLGLYLALALTNSRTAMLAFSGCIGIAAAVLATHIRISKQWLKVVAVVLVLLAVIFLCYGGMSASLNMISRVHDTQTPETTAEDVELAEQTREIDFSNMSGRTRIYKAVIPACRDNPKALWTGRLDANVMTEVNVYQEYAQQHMHNSFLQVFMLLGIPGLLLILVLTVMVILSSLKLLFIAVPMAEKFLILVPCFLLVSSLVESLVFVPWANLMWSLLNFVFLVFCGYVLEAGGKYSFPMLFAKTK